MQATLEAVRRIATFGKQREYRMNPDLLRTFTTLKLSEDVGEINPFAPPPKDDDTRVYLPSIPFCSLTYQVFFHLFSFSLGTPNGQGEAKKQETVYTKKGEKTSEEGTRDRTTDDDRKWGC